MDQYIPTTVDLIHAPVMWGLFQSTVVQMLVRMVYLWHGVAVHRPYLTFIMPLHQ